MGFQLWSSPVTGYRRTGTRLAEITGLIESAISARAIAEPLKSCPMIAGADEMKNLLDPRGFDVAGAQETEDGPVLGYVETSKLTHGNIRDHCLPIAAKMMIGDSAPLSAVLMGLRILPFLFVETECQVAGIITRADLNKPPARVYFFGIVSMLEMHLTFWVHRAYGKTWQQFLSAERMEAAVHLFQERKKRNQELELIDCLQFGDKKALLLKSHKTCELFQWTSKRDTERFFKRAENIRNCLAHGQHDLSEGSQWDEVIDTVDRSIAFLTTSDQLIDRRGEAVSSEFSETLWGPNKL